MKLTICVFAMGLAAAVAVGPLLAQDEGGEYHDDDSAADSYAAEGGSYAGYEGSPDCADCSDEGTAYASSKRRPFKRSYSRTPKVRSPIASRQGWPPVDGHRIVGKREARAMALQYPWHCNYYHVEYGSPVALVVPPTAERQWNMGWGVSNGRLSRIWHQFQRAYPGPAAGDAGTGAQYMATPPWPSDTSQFGVYYVRGPW